MKQVLKSVKIIDKQIKRLIDIKEKLQHFFEITVLTQKQ